MAYVLSCTRCLLSNSFRTKKLTDCFQLLLTKKPVSFDYVAVDATAMVATALRLSKHVSTEQRRNKEVARHVAQNLQQFLRKVHCKKSLLVALDGPEGLLKAHITRSSTLTKRLESRLVRLPGTALMQAVEDRIVRVMPDRHIACREIVVSGTRVPGGIEEKITSWALDLACNEKHNRNEDSLAMFGPSELFLNVMGLTPYFQATSLVQHGTDLRQLRWADMMEWLELSSLATQGESLRVALARTDALFLYLLSYGCSAMDLPPIMGGGFSYFYNRYTQINRYGEDEGREAVSQEKVSHVCLFQDTPGNSLTLDVAALSQLFQSSTSRMKEDSTGRFDGAAESYLEHLLHVHATLCLGRNPNPGLIPTYLLTGSQAKASSNHVSATQLAQHVRSLIAKGTVQLPSTTPRAPSLSSRSATPLWSNQQPLTAGEFTILSYSQAHLVEASIQTFVGSAPKSDVAKKITDEKAAAARGVVQEVLAYGNAEQPNKVLCFSPSFLWQKCEKSDVWEMAYVDTGARSEEKEVRRTCNAVAGVAMSVAGNDDGKPIVFSPLENKWVSIPNYPFHCEVQTQGESSTAATAPDKLRVLTWNVMFDRYSGQPTPLGMPGIDWCSPKRYPVLSRCIEAEDADVVGLQEVEPSFAEYLANEPWCRERYLLSCASNSAALEPWGVLMLIRRGRFTLTQFSHANVPAWSGHVSLMPIVSLTLPGRQTVMDIAAVHLIAPFTKANESARTGQDAALRQRAVKSLASDAIVMGDFNDWPGNEFVMPVDTLYKECWPCVHPNEPGKTMDDSNTFCKLKVEEIFFGRSDKVFVRSRVLQPSEAHLVGTKSVNEENQDSDAPAYLFPSDHYGVSMAFTLTGVPKAAS